MLKKGLIFGVTVVMLAGCVSMPTGPRVAVMPAPGKPFELFVQEDKICRQFAEQSIGKNANDRAAETFVGSAAAGAAIGATVGGLLGGHDGASSGAGMGIITGSMIGAEESRYSASDAQRRYDIAYQQCMYAKGNQLPGQSYQGQIYYPPPPPR